MYIKLCWIMMMFTGSAAQATDVHKLNDWQQYNYADYVHQRLMSFNDIDIEQVYELYNIRSPASDPKLSDATLVSDIRATCPIDEIARVAAQASKSPVYRFQVGFIRIIIVQRCNWYLRHVMIIVITCTMQNELSTRLSVNWWIQSFRYVA